MNLERIIPQNQNYIVLKKISEFKKLYLCMDISTTLQKINTGALIEAFNFKNITQFKGLRPFFILSEDRIIDNVLKDGGILGKYDTELQIGSVVDYVGLTYDVLGFVVNTYAQWNMPTPLLLNPNKIADDYKSLFQGKMTDYQINEKINDNFQSGKYDNEIIFPLVDGNDFKNDILVVKKRPTEQEISLYIAKVNKQKNMSLKATKNIFIDTILDTSGNEIQKLREVDEDLYDKTRGFMNMVNDIINNKLETGKKVKQIEQKITEPIKVEEEADLSFLDELDDVFSDDFLQQIDDTF
jgi:hypothetical protein